MLNLKSVSVWSHLVNELPPAISWTRRLGSSVSISCSFVAVCTLRMRAQVFRCSVLCCLLSQRSPSQTVTSAEVTVSKCRRGTLNLQRSCPDAKCVSALYRDKFIISNKQILFYINLFDILTFPCCRGQKIIWHKAKMGKRCIHCPPFFTVAKESKIDT